MKKAVCVAVLVAGLLAPAFGANDGIFYAQGPKGVKQAALTFDDGPGIYTERILAVLRQYGVKATFFMDGSQVEIRPAIARQVAADGHEIGSHLYSHTDLYHYNKPDAPQLVSGEIDKTAKIIQNTVGVHPVLLRMPNGYVRQWVRDIARQKGVKLINWTFGCDWTPMAPEALTDAYIKAIGSGAIFLMHDGGKNRQRTLDMLPKLIEALQAKGYRIVTVSELLKTPAVADVSPGAVKNSGK